MCYKEWGGIIRQKFTQCWSRACQEPSSKSHLSWSCPLNLESLPDFDFELFSIPKSFVLAGLKVDYQEVSLLGFKAVGSVLGHFIEVMLALGARHSFGETLPLERIVGCLFAHLQTLAGARSLRHQLCHPHWHNPRLDLTVSLRVDSDLELVVSPLSSRQDLL